MRTILRFPSCRSSCLIPSISIKVQFLSGARAATSPPIDQIRYTSAMTLTRRVKFLFFLGSSAPAAARASFTLLHVTPFSPRYLAPVRRPFSHFPLDDSSARPFNLKCRRVPSIPRLNPESCCRRLILPPFYFSRVTSLFVSLPPLVSPGEMGSIARKQSKESRRVEHRN